MTHETLTFDDLDNDTFLLSGVDLTSDQMNQATQMSQAAAHPDQQWQVYLYALALQGVEQWLAERAPELSVSRDSEFLLQPPWVCLLDTACYLQVNGFRLCLITPGIVMDSLVSCPRAIVDLPAFVPHLYVLIEVIEEQEQIQVVGALRRDQLVQRQQATPLAPKADWIYSLPLEWFELDADQLLLCLRGLSPAAIPLPEPETVEPVAIARLQDKLVQMGAAREPSTYKPWEVLTWDEAALLLQTPDLARQFYALQTPEIPQSEVTDAAIAVPPSTNQAAAVSPSLTQRAINAALWLQDQLDDLAEELSWMLLPNLTPALGLRTVTTQFDRILDELQHQGITIPPHARGACSDLKWAGMGVRLYAITWSLPTITPDELSEWTLLIVVGPHPDLPLPSGLRLLVQDNIRPLSDQVLTPDRGQQYLYTQVAGTWQEQFWITVDFTNGTVITLPPLTFSPDRARDIKSD